MVLNRAELRINEYFSIKINKDASLRLEDAYRKNQEILITCDASHLALKNAHGTVYRHDTIPNDFPSFIFPHPKPVIERHGKGSKNVYGKVVAVDNVKTKFYDEFAAKFNLEDLSSKEYIQMVKDEILPFQKQNSWYNGLSYLQLASKITHKDGIEKILNGEFSNVSIGADPIRLVCSECQQDQVQKMCNHFALRGNNIFMLAESLEYEELSFVPRGADPFGRISKIHDEKEEDAEISVISVHDLYKIAEGKTMVCVENICTICDQEDEMALRKTTKSVTSISYEEEFGQERLGKIELGEIEDKISLEDEEKAELKDNQFAINQSTGEQTKRRFPINSKANVIAALALLDEAVDLTDQEREKAVIHIRKQAKKFDISIQDEKTEVLDEAKDEIVPEVKLEDEGIIDETVEALLQKLVDKISLIDSDEKLQDWIGETIDGEGKPKPIHLVLNALQSLGSTLKWAGNDLVDTIDGFLKQLGKIAIDKGTYDSLEDELKDIKDEVSFKDEEITLLDKQNVELNHLVRVSHVDSIINGKKALGKLEDEATERTKLMGYTYETLKELSSEMKTSPTNNSALNNIKNINTVKNPTLLDEEDAEDNHKENEIKFTEKDLVQGFKSLFRK